MKKIITSDFFTTISLNQFFYSFKALTINIFSLRKWDNIILLEKLLLNYLWLKKSKIISFYDARSALYNCLINIKHNSENEVIISWYNCISVVNSIIQAWYKPIYVDIDKNTLNKTLDWIKKKINKNTKVIIIQHTFWIAFDFSKLDLDWKDIVIIEDCAHSLWSKVGWTDTWVKWDFSIFSFWRDKVISWVWWWVLIINNSKFFKLFDNLNKKLSLPSINKVIKNHLYNIIAYISYKTYNFLNIWKIIMHFSVKYWILNKILTKEEKVCNYKKLNYWLSNSQASLVIKDLLNIDLYNKHRWVIVLYYKNNLKSNLFTFQNLDNISWNNYFRTYIICKDKSVKDKIYKYMKNHDIYLWNTWSDSNIAPKWVDFKKAKYKIWECKNAEYIADRILFLPNHKNIKIDDAIYITNLLNNINIDEL